MTIFLASSLKLQRDSQHENFCFCSQSFIHTLDYSRKKSLKGFPQLQKSYSAVLYLLWGQLNMLFHCFAFFCISIRIFPFFLASFTTKMFRPEVSHYSNHWVPFSSDLQQQRPHGVWERIREDSQWVSSIRNVWIRAVLWAEREIDPGSLCKSFSRACDGPVTFLTMPGR